ncbi:hypothetical protein LIA77_07047 [Sarocladium implicatum]|nr:hypothetical protein LIA77_07047 [Sarocladium implicatum]
MRVVHAGIENLCQTAFLGKVYHIHTCRGQIGGLRLRLEGQRGLRQGLVDG